MERIYVNRELLFLATVIFVTTVPADGSQNTNGSQNTYEGDRLFVGHHREVGETDPQWTMDAYDSKCTFATDDGKLSIRLEGGFPGTDGAVLRTLLKSANGNDGLAHTIDVAAARPGCFWKGAHKSAGGAGWSVAVPIDGASCKRYCVYLGDAGPGSDPRLTDQLTVAVYQGAKGQPPEWHKINVDGLNVDRLNRYRMAMDADGRLNIYVNDIAKAVFSQNEVPTSLDSGNHALFGLHSPRSQHHIFSRYRIDIDAILINTSVGQFEPPGALQAADGKSTYTIVGDPQAVDMEYFAALELAHYLEEISGSRPAVTSKADPGSERNIYMGRSAEVDAMLPDVNWDKLGTDGIVIRTVGKNLVLSGGRPRGTLFAVYTLLQDTLGCRWWAPGAESIPSRPAIELSELAPKNVVYRSPFDFRLISAQGTGKPFAFKHRLNGADMKFDPDGGSILQHLLPGTKYFADHPEWYAYFPEKGGTHAVGRDVEVDFEGEYNWTNGLKYVKESRTEAMYQAALRTHRLPWQPCMTHPGVLKQVTENVLENLADQYASWEYLPKIVWIVQQDGRWICNCDRCQALCRREGSESAAWVRFLNAVAQRVEKKYPDVLVGMHAYLHTIKPPRTIRPRDNVLIYMAVLDRDHKIPLGKLPNLKSYAAEWAQISQHTWLWDYSANFGNYLVPHPNHFVMGETIQYCEKIGFNGIRVQGSFGTLTELVHMRNWVHSQLLWDPQQDPRRLVEEFLDGYYGPAAPHLMSYLDYLHEVIRRDGGKFLSCFSSGTEGWLMLDDLNRATTLFNEAAAAVAGQEPYAARLATARLSIDIAWLLRYEELSKQASRQGVEFLAPEDPRSLIAELEKIQHAAGHYRERREFPELVEQLRTKFK